MDEFQNKYRIPSTRTQWWDYGNFGRYFITICTQNRLYFFGEIKNKIMRLSEIGRMAYCYWMEIPHHFDFVFVDEFVVMPNHIHGILILTGNNNGGGIGINDNTNNPPAKNDSSTRAKARFHPSSVPANLL